MAESVLADMVEVVVKRQWLITYGAGRVAALVFPVSGEPVAAAGVAGGLVM